MVFHEPRIIKVNGEEVYLLRHWVGDEGIIVEVSGPQSLPLDDYHIVEYDGRPLDLNLGVLQPY